MRNINKYFLAAMAGITFLTSCAPDEEITIDDRDKFVNTWTCNETGGSSGTDVYTVTVSRKGDADSVLLKNFYNLGTSFSAVGLVSGNSIVVPQQTLDGNQLNGSGIFSNNGFNIDFTAVDGTQTYNVRTVYSN